MSYKKAHAITRKPHQNSILQPTDHVKKSPVKTTFDKVLHKVTPVIEIILINFVNHLEFDKRI